MLIEGLHGVAPVEVFAPVHFVAVAVCFASRIAAHVQTTLTAFAFQAMREAAKFVGRHRAGETMPFAVGETRMRGRSLVELKTDALDDVLGLQIGVWVLLGQLPDAASDHAVELGQRFWRI